MQTAIPIALINRGERIRAVVSGKVDALVSSIADCGLLNPITVSLAWSVKDGKACNSYMLIAGLHRLEAMIKIGATEIPAVVVDLIGPQAVIAECDENLCGSNLSQAERSLFTRRRKEAYVALHPETAHGTPGVSRQVGDTRDRSETDRFTADAVAKTGKPERTIQRDAERGEKIPEPILQQITGTELDKGVVLDRLAKAPDPEKELDAIRAEKDARKAARLLAEESAKEAKKANAATDTVIRLTVEQQYADWIMRHVAMSELDTLIAWIQTAKPAGIIAALRRNAA